MALTNSVVSVKASGAAPDTHQASQAAAAAAAQHRQQQQQQHQQKQHECHQPISIPKKLMNS
jgi:hypothetical protein